MSVRSAIGGIVGGVIGWFVGGGPYGAAVGFSIGAGVGAYTDTVDIPGIKLGDATVQTSTVGGTITFGAGAFPTSGNIIWAGPIKENKIKKKESGKGGGTSTTTYQYLRSYAIGVSETIDKYLIIKRNGKVVYSTDPSSPVDDVSFSSKWLSKVTLYYGSETQMPDPTIVAVEGVGNVSPFRGIAYIVVKQDDLSDVLGAVPQFEFVVSRVVVSSTDVSSQIRGVTLIPSTGESSYATTKSAVGRGDRVSSSNFWNNKTLLHLNYHSNNGKVDLVNSIEDLDRTLPNCDTVSVVISWFGNDLRANVCEIKPGYALASHYRTWYPTNAYQWMVQGFKHDSSSDYVHFVTNRETQAVYGSTPSDWAVIECLRYLKSKGKRIVFYPFVLMDIPANSLPNPYGGSGQPINPWRGRVTCNPAPGVAGSPDGTAAAGAQIDTFFTRSFGFNRMIYHYIEVCQEAGVLDANDVFLIGSEMVGITKVRDSATHCRAVDYFKTLAAAAKSTLGCKVGYAADWSEYKGHQYGSDLIFGMDPLWSDSNIDFIGIDNYFPIADVRDTDNVNKIYDIDYLKSNIEGGELWDWYYIDRNANLRASITDGAYGEPWVYRQKDIRSFWANQHYNRIGGVRDASPTSWVPNSKPIWFTEFGCAAIDRGPNQPNVFYDPNSSESTFPYFSTGARDDNAQYSYLKATIEYWNTNGGSMISTANMIVWTWDARPYPEFPAQLRIQTSVSDYILPGQEHTWGDYTNYPRGHWLQGRLGSSEVGAEISNIVERINVSSDLLDLSQLRATKLQGYRVASESSAVTILQTFQAAFFFDVAEYDRKINFIQRGNASVVNIPYSDLLPADDADEDALIVERVQEAELLRKLTMTAFDPTISYAVNSQTAERRISTIKASSESSQELALVLMPDDLATIASKRIKISWGETERFEFKTTLKYAYLTETDVVILNDQDGLQYRCRITYASEDSGIRHFKGVLDADFIYATEATGISALPPVSTAPGLIGLTTVYPVDIPVQADNNDEYGCYLAIVGDGSGWKGAQIQLSTDGGATISSTAEVTVDSTYGNTVTDLMPEVSSEYLSDQTLTITLSDTPDSVSREVLLNYTNKLAVKADSGEWIVIQFQTVVTNDDGSFTLSGLINGRYNTNPTLVTAGASIVLIDEFLSFVQLPTYIFSTGLSYRAVSYGGDEDDAEWATIPAPSKSQTEWEPSMLATTRDGSNNVTVTWVGRGRISAEIAPRNSKYFTAYRIVWSDGVITDTTATTFTRASVPAGVTVKVCGLNSITGEGQYTATKGT